jgi:hypothetical protein
VNRIIIYESKDFVKLSPELLRMGKIGHFDRSTLAGWNLPVVSFA